MKNNLPKIFILNILLVLVTGQAFAVDVYDWTGGSLSWTSPTNWLKNGSPQTATGTYPGLIATDSVRIGVKYRYASSTNYTPTISTNITLNVAAITFGNDLQPFGTLTSGTGTGQQISGARADIGLTVGSTTSTNALLYVHGPILQMHSNTGGPANSGGNDAAGGAGVAVEAIKNTINGYGTLHCASFTVGDTGLPGNRFCINNTHVIVGNGTTLRFIIDNDLLLLTQSSNQDDPTGPAPSRSSNSNLELTSGTLTINGTLRENNNAYGGYIAAYIIYAATATFKMQTNTVAPVLNLGGSVPLNVVTPVAYAYDDIDFYVPSGTNPIPTVNYTGTNQKVSTYNSGGTTTEVKIDKTPTAYPNLTFSGSGTDTLGAGTLNLSGNFTLNGGSVSVDLSKNNPTLTVPGTFSTGAGTTFINGTQTATLSGNFNNDGTCNFGTALVYFNSTATATFTGTSPVTFTNVKFDGGGLKNMTSGSFNIAPTGVLTMGTTATQLAANGFLTLLSDPTGSATVAPVTAGSITGNVNVQRYMSASRSYRLISSPVHTGGFDATNNVYYNSLAYLKKGMWLTGYSDDFDKNVLAAGTGPTLYLYREDVPYSNASFVSGNFRDIRSFPVAPATDTLDYTIDTDGSFKIPVGTGIQAYFRGNRSVPLATATAPGAAATSSTFTATGILNTGQIIFKDWFNVGGTYLSATQSATSNSYNLVGNPYPAAINWDTWQQNSGQQTTGIYAPGVLNATYVLKTNGNYAIYQNGLGTNGGTNTIASGQGFYVIANSNTAQLYFNESAKFSTSQGSDIFMGKPVVADVKQYLRLQLAKDTVNTDDIIIRFSNAANTRYVKNEDALSKPGQGRVSLSSFSSDHVALAINQMPYSKNIQAIPLNVAAVSNGTYTLNLTQIAGVPQLYDIWMLDTYTKDSVNMRVAKTYSFNILKSDTNTYGSKRFILFMRQNPLYAYKLLKFDAQKTDNRQVSIVWKTQNEASYTNFAVERSTDGGKTFEIIGSVTSSNQGTYSMLDKNPITGQNIYKLQQQDNNDITTYSNSVTIVYAGNDNLNAKNKITVYPNPATSSITLSVPEKTSSDNFNIRIMNSSGVIVKQVASTQNDWTGNVSNLLTGTYIIEVVNNKDKSLVGQTKLIKL